MAMMTPGVYITEVVFSPVISNKIVVESYEPHPSYTLVRMSRNVLQNELLKELEKWCIQCQCGKRVSHNSFAFKTEEELTMFRMKWL